MTVERWSGRHNDGVMTATIRTRARRGEGALLREEILAAADALLIETGSEESVSIRGIGDRVGVSAPSIYRHFEDKDALMFAVCERTFGRLDEAMERAAAGIADPYDALVARGLTYVRFGLEYPQHYRMTLMGSVKDDKAVVLDGHHLTGEVVQGSRAFNHLVDAAVRVLGRRRSPTPVELAGEIWAYVHGVTSLRINYPTMPWPTIEVQMRMYVD
jgi:AcrR family transcriptional regulator